MCGYLACFSLLLRDNVLWAGQILCFGFCQLCAILWASPADAAISGATVFYIWPVVALPEWMCLLSVLCFVQNSVRGRSSSPDHSRRQDGFHQLWKAMVCGWACAVWNISAEQGHFKLLLQSLLMSDENGTPSLCKVLFLLLKSTNWSTLWFDIQILVIFFKRKNAVGVILVWLFEKTCCT